MVLAILSHPMIEMFAVQAAAFSSLNGIGLALVLSSVQSVLADIYRPEQRGLAFGIMLTAASVGTLQLHLFLATVG